MWDLCTHDAGEQVRLDPLQVGKSTLSELLDMLVRPPWCSRQGYPGVLGMLTIVKGWNWPQKLSA